VEGDVSELKQIPVCETASDGYSFHIDECPVPASPIFHDDFLLRDANYRVMAGNLGPFQTNRHPRQTSNFVVANGKRKGQGSPFETDPGLLGLLRKSLRGFG
jgi:hypothetical protein